MKRQRAKPKKFADFEDVTNANSTAGHSSRAEVPSKRARACEKKERVAEKSAQSSENDENSGDFELMKPVVYGSQFEKADYNFEMEPAVESSARTEEDPSMNVADLHERKKPFSLQNELSGTSSESQIERLQTSVRNCDILDIGRVLRQGFLEGTLTEAQIQEVAKSSEKPSFSTQYMASIVESADQQDMKSLFLAQHFLNTIPSSETKSIKKVEASVNSMASTIHKQYRLGPIKNKELSIQHDIRGIGEFSSINLSLFFQRASISGDTALNQITSLFTQILKIIVEPAHRVWIYTFRPSCRRDADKHFKSLPPSLVTSLHDFAADALRLYLPERLLIGEIDTDDEFLNVLSVDDPKSEVMRRRSGQSLLTEVVNTAIANSIRNLRNFHHYDLATQALVGCGNRKDCVRHLKWLEVKAYREYLLQNGRQENEYSAESVFHSRAIEGEQLEKGNDTIP